MIVDSSALIAVLKREPDAPVYERALVTQPARISTATWVESSIVAARLSAQHLTSLDTLLSTAGVKLESFTEEHARRAREAYLRFGKGSGSRAQLNYGDCLAYAFASIANEPLLFKGDDFCHTDVIPALT